MACCLFDAESLSEPRHYWKFDFVNKFQKNGNKGVIIIFMNENAFGNYANLNVLTHVIS